MPPLTLMQDFTQDLNAWFHRQFVIVYNAWSEQHLLLYGSYLTSVIVMILCYLCVM